MIFFSINNIKFKNIFSNQSPTSLKNPNFSLILFFSSISLINFNKNSSKSIISLSYIDFSISNCFSLSFNSSISFLIPLYLSSKSSNFFNSINNSSLFFLILIISSLNLLLIPKILSIFFLFSSKLLFFNLTISTFLSRSFNSLTSSFKTLISLTNSAFFFK